MRNSWVADQLQARGVAIFRAFSHAAAARSVRPSANASATCRCRHRASRLSEAAARVAAAALRRIVRCTAFVLLRIPRRLLLFASPALVRR